MRNKEYVQTRLNYAESDLASTRSPWRVNGSNIELIRIMNSMSAMFRLTAAFVNSLKQKVYQKSKKEDKVCLSKTSLY